MRKHSDINFNYTYRLHIILVITIYLNKFGVIGKLHFHKRMLPFHNFSIFRICFLYKKDLYIENIKTYIQKKAYILIVKVMIKDLQCCLCNKTQYSFILNYRGVVEEVCVCVCVCLCVCMCVSVRACVCVWRRGGDGVLTK